MVRKKGSRNRKNVEQVTIFCLDLKDNLSMWELEQDKRPEMREVEQFIARKKETCSSTIITKKKPKDEAAITSQINEISLKDTSSSNSSRLAPPFNDAIQFFIQ